MAGNVTHYSVRAEGSQQAVNIMDPASWDDALGCATHHAAETGRNHVIRVCSPEGARIVATVTPEGEICWPRLATPTMRDTAGAV